MAKDKAQEPETVTVPAGFIFQSDQQAKQLLARDMEEMKKHPINETVIGGQYLGTDGELHDAHGKPLKDSK